MNLLARLALAGPRPPEAAPAILRGYRTALRHGLRGPLFALNETADKARERLRSKTPADPAYFELAEEEVRIQAEAGWPSRARGISYERITVLCRDGRRAEAAAACRETAARAVEAGDRCAAGEAWHNLGMILAGDAALGEDAARKADAA
ncbi:MAG: hypothetical protein MUC63_03445, partial [Planctomycetes bacterium]|nr:hypothetical protein [Planctomycetota bacterium]